MKMDWLNYSRHVLKWLFAALSIFTIFSADYVDIPIGALIACLYAPPALRTGAGQQPSQMV